MLPASLTKKELLASAVSLSQDVFLYGLMTFFVLLILRRFYEEFVNTSILWKLFILLVVTGPFLFLSPKKDYYFSHHYDDKPFS